MIKKYKGWNIEFIGHGYELTRITPVDGKILKTRAKTQEHAKAVITNHETRIKAKEAIRAKAEREQVITKRYSVQLKGHKPVVFELQRGPSGASAYGNQTSVVVHEDDRLLGVIDTRYDHGVMEDFGAWCINYLKSYIAPEYEPKFTEI